jgi:hypothetical protein
MPVPRSYICKFIAHSLNGLERGDLAFVSDKAEPMPEAPDVRSYIKYMVYLRQIE